MPEQDGATFPKKLYNDAQDVIEADSQETLDLALSRGWKLVPPALNTIPKLKERIAEVEAELKDLKENLAAKIHETEIAMKAEEILGKMQADKAAQEAEAQALAEKQAAEAEKAEEERISKEAIAKAEAEVGSAQTVPPQGGPASPPATAPESGPPPATKAAAEFGERGKKK